MKLGQRVRHKRLRWRGTITRIDAEWYFIDYNRRGYGYWVHHDLLDLL
jgi:heat shock protein HspQ